MSHRNLKLETIFLFIKQLKANFLIHLRTLLELTDQIQSSYQASRIQVVCQGLKHMIQCHQEIRHSLHWLVRLRQIKEIKVQDISLTCRMFQIGSHKLIKIVFTRMNRRQFRMLIDFWSLTMLKEWNLELFKYTRRSKIKRNWCMKLIMIFIS